MKTAWPTVEDITNRLTPIGSIPSTLNLTQLRGVAIADLEAATRFSPFLASSTAAAETRLYNEAPYGVLNFRCGFVSTEDVTITIQDVVKTAGTDYTLRRDTTDTNGPYTYAVFTSSYGYDLESIEVEGVVGWGKSIPDDVWNAVLEMVCEKATPYIQATRSNGLAEIGIGNGDLKVKFDNTTNLFAAAGSARKRLIDRYRLKAL